MLYNTQTTDHRLHRTIIINFSPLKASLNNPVLSYILQYFHLQVYWRNYFLNVTMLQWNKSLKLNLMRNQKWWGLFIESNYLQKQDWTAIISNIFFLVDVIAHGYSLTTVKIFLRNCVYSMILIKVCKTLLRFSSKHIPKK